MRRNLPIPSSRFQPFTLDYTLDSSYNVPASFHPEEDEKVTWRHGPLEADVSEGASPIALLVLKGSVYTCMGKVTAR